MKRILFIALKDLQQNLRERTTFLFLLIMPVAFTLLFGAAFGGFNRDKTVKDTRLVVGIIDQDQSRYSQALITALDQSSVIRLDAGAGTTPAELEKMVADGKLPAVLVIPAGYGQGVETGQLVKLPVSLDPVSPNGAAIQSELLTAANRLKSASAIARIAARNQGSSFDAALVYALAAWRQPAVRLEVAGAANEQKTAAPLMSMEQISPGMMIQFAIAGLLTAAQVLVYERKSRCMQRLLSTSTSRLEILLGHYLAIFTLILVQFALLIAFGQLLLRLDYLRLPLATLIMAVTTAAFIAALGLFIGSLARTDDQAIIFALIPMFVFAGLGGAWMPLEATGEVFRTIGHLSPVAWAMDGFKAIIANGLSLNAIWLPAAALLGYAALFGGLAVWKFKYE